MEEKYEIGLKADNGFKLFINGSLLIDAWRNHSAGHSQTERYKFDEDKLYDIIVEFYENLGSCEAILGIAKVK